MFLGSGWLAAGKKEKKKPTPANRLRTFNYVKKRFPLDSRIAGTKEIEGIFISGNLQLSQLSHLLHTAHVGTASLCAAKE
eukprot:636651-Pelagomonas_calceolata.AAC.5